MNKTRIAVAGLLILALTGCKDKIEPGAAGMARAKVSGAATMKIGLQPTAIFHDAAATVTPLVESSVSGRIMGPVVSVSVEEGDRVKKGQLLIVIESEEISSKKAAAEAAYREAVKARTAAEQNRNLAENTYNRFKNLYQEKALSLQEFDKIKTQKELAVLEYERMQESAKRAEAGLDEAEVYQSYKEIASPVDGLVTGRFIDPGTMAMPGMRLLTIEDTSRYRLEAEIDESLAGKITPGVDAEVEIKALQKILQGKVSKIVKAVDPHSRTFKVIIALPPETDLHSGLYARVKIPVGREELVLVPAEAVVSKGQLTGVYVVDSDRIVIYRLVRLGRKYGKKVEILSGLQPGETIIAEKRAGIGDGVILEPEK